MQTAPIGKVRGPRHYKTLSEDAMLKVNIEKIGTCTLQIQNGGAASGFVDSANQALYQRRGR
jgi:hypothetical protein